MRRLTAKNSLHVNRKLLVITLNTYSRHMVNKTDNVVFYETPYRTFCLLQSRDVTKFEFEFDNVRTSNVFNRLEIRRMF